MLLTQSTTPVIGWISTLLGYVMEFIFSCLNSVGLANIGLCIIIFTIFVRLIMLPLTIKQQKFSKISQAMQPEINAIQKKYRGKRDQASVQKQNEEIQAVYQKYGTSPTGGCLQVLIQLPIFLALYQVIRKIPAYIPQVKDVYMNVVTAVKTQDGYISAINKIADGLNSSYVKELSQKATDNQIIDVMNYFNSASWDKLADAFPSISDSITKYSSELFNMNNFFGGINIAEAPGLKISVYLVIPILAALFQYLSTKTMPQPQDPSSANMTRSMTLMMPLMSLYFCIIMPAGLGLYWVTSAAFQCLQQVVLNKYFDSQDLDEMVQKNVAKAEKKKKSGKKSITDRVMNAASGMKPGQDEGKPVRTATEIAAIKTKGLKIPSVNGEEYNSILERIDTTKTGEISKRAFRVLQYDKENNTKGGK